MTRPSLQLKPVAALHLFVSNRDSLIGKLREIDDEQSRSGGPFLHDSISDNVNEKLYFSILQDDKETTLIF